MVTEIVTHDLKDDAVTNAKLANVDTATIKGRTTAGSGNPEDLTAAQATAILAAMVGDSGSGGTKGLVPAPAAGDAAAGKYLKADATWAVPPGSGGAVTGVVFNDQATVPGGTPAAGEGALWEHATQKQLMFTNEKGLDEYISRLLFAQTASVTVSGTATETTLVGTGIGTVTLPVNYLLVGKTIRLRASGFFSTAGTASQTLNIRFKYGSTVLLATVNTAGFAVALTNQHWSIDCEFTVRSVGGSGTVFAQAYPCFWYFSAPTGAKAQVLDSTATVTIDTTAATAIDLTADWNSGVAGDTITCTNLTLESLA